MSSLNKETSVELNKETSVELNKETSVELNVLLWAVYRNDYMLDIMLYGTYNDCIKLLFLLGRKKYLIEPYGVNHRRRIKSAIKVDDILGTLDNINQDCLYSLSKYLVRFRLAPPPLIRQNARYFH